MVKRDMKKALGASLKAEEQAVRSRFEKTETVPGKSARVLRARTKTGGAGQVGSDSFIADGDDELISRIERRCLRAGLSVNRSEVLRAGLAALDALRERELRRVFERLPREKTGPRRREIHISVVHRAHPVKLRRPFRIKRFQLTRKVIIGHSIATIYGARI